MSRSDDILAGLKAQNEPATFEEQQGFWCQADCVFIHARHPTEAINRYRRDLADAMIGISHNLFCGDIRALRVTRELSAARSEAAALREALDDAGQQIRLLAPAANEAADLRDRLAALGEFVQEVALAQPRMGEMGRLQERARALRAAAQEPARGPDQPPAGCPDGCFACRRAECRARGSFDNPHNSDLLAGYRCRHCTLGRDGTHTLPVLCAAEGR